MGYWSQWLPNQGGYNLGMQQAPQDTGNRLWGLDKMAAILSDNIFKYIFLTENFRSLNKSWLKYVPWGLIDNIAALFQIMAWRQIGAKPLSEVMMICFTDTFMHHLAAMS